MTRDQIALVQSTYAAVEPIADQAAALFYARLFEIAPEVKPLFKADITQQGRKLMATLGVVVRGLSDLPSILPAASALARKHVQYGVRAQHYAPVGTALLWTLEHGLGDRWSPEAADAWTEAYAILSGYMIGEAYGRASAAE